MKSETAGLGELGQLGITVSDLKRSIPFYRDVLGLRHLFDAPPGMSFFACGNVRLMLSVPEGSGGERFGAAIYFRVADIHATRDLLVSRGLSFEAEPRLIARMPDHELWIGFFRDPDKNLLALMAEKR